MNYVPKDDRLYHPEEVDEAISRPTEPGSMNRDFIQKKEEVEFAKTFVRIPTLEEFQNYGSYEPAVKIGINAFRGWYAKFGRLRFDLLREDDLLTFSRLKTAEDEEGNAITPLTEHRDFDYPNWKFL